VVSGPSLGELEAYHDTGMPTLEETTVLVRTVFESVWTEFHSQCQAYSRKMIESLTVPEFPVSSQQIDEQFLNDSPTVWLPDSTQEMEYTVSEPFFSPHPPYECCTPCTQSILHGDDPEAMPFIPFADDPKFDHLEHTLHYKRFAWQSDSKHDLYNLDSDRRSRLSHPPAQPCP
jgi:hypothetical protein